MHTADAAYFQVLQAKIGLNNRQLAQALNLSHAAIDRHRAGDVRFRGPIKVLMQLMAEAAAESKDVAKWEDANIEFHARQ